MSKRLQTERERYDNRQAKVQAKADRWENRQAERGEDRRKDASENPFLRQLNRQADKQFTEDGRLKVDQATARDLRRGLKDKYPERYTRESFTEEYRAATGRDPDKKTVSRWLSDGIGVGQFSDQHRYESQNVTVQYYDKHWLPILRNTEEKPAHILKIHRNAGAYRDFYGSGQQYIGEDRAGAVHIVPNSVVGGTSSRGTLSDFTKAGDSRGLAQQLRKLGLNPEQFSVAQSIRPAPSKGGFFEQDVGHQLDDVFNTKAFSRFSNEVFDKWVPNEVKFLGDPLGYKGSFIEEDANRDAVKGGANLFNTEEKNIHIAQNYMNAGADLLLSAYGYAWAAGLKNAARANTMYIGGQISEDARDSGVSSGLTSAAIAGAASFASWAGGDYINSLDMGTAATATANTAWNYGVNVGAGVAGGQSVGDAATSAAWSTAARTTNGGSNLARLAVDSRYRDQVSDPVGAAYAALNTYSAYQSGQEAARLNQEAGGTGSYWESVQSNLGLNSRATSYKLDPVTGKKTQVGVPGTFNSSADWSGARRTVRTPAMVPGGAMVSQKTGWPAFRANTVDSFDRATEALTSGSAWKRGIQRTLTLESNGTRSQWPEYRQQVNNYGR